MPKNYYVLVKDIFNEKHKKKLKRGIYNEWKGQFEYVQGVKGVSVKQNWDSFDTLEEAESFYKKNYRPDTMILSRPVNVSFSKNTGIKITTPDIILEFDIAYFFAAKTKGHCFEDSNIVLETNGTSIVKISLLNDELSQTTTHQLQQKYPDFYIGHQLKSNFQKCHIISKAVLKKFIKRMFEGRNLEEVSKYFKLEDVNLKNVATQIYQLYQNLISDIDNLFIGTTQENNAQGNLTSLLIRYVEMNQKEFEQLGQQKNTLSSTLQERLQQNWPLMFKVTKQMQSSKTFQGSPFYNIAYNFESLLSGFYNANFSIPTSGFSADQVKLLLSYYDKLFRFCYVAKDFRYSLSTSSALKRKIEDRDNSNEEDKEQNIFSLSDEKTQVPLAKKPLTSSTFSQRLLSSNTIMNQEDNQKYELEDDADFWFSIVIPESTTLTTSAKISEKNLTADNEDGSVLSEDFPEPVTQSDFTTSETNAYDVESTARDEREEDSEDDLIDNTPSEDDSLIQLTPCTTTKSDSKSEKSELSDDEVKISLERKTSVNLPVNASFAKRLKQITQPIPENLQTANQMETNVGEGLSATPSKPQQTKTFTKSYNPFG